MQLHFGLPFSGLFQAFLDSEDPSASARSYSLASELGMVRMVRG